MITIIYYFCLTLIVLYLTFFVPNPVGTHWTLNYFFLIGCISWMSVLFNSISDKWGKKNESISL